MAIKYAVLSVLFSTLLISFGQIFLKKGVNVFSDTPIFNNYLLLIGIIFYLTSGLIFVVALKFAELSLLYPIIATTYIWVSILSPLFFQADSMNPQKWLGIFSIVIGVSFMGIGANKKNAK